MPRTATVPSALPPVPRALALSALLCLAAGVLSAQTSVGTGAQAAALAVGGPRPAAAFHAEGRAPYWTLGVDPGAATVTWGRLGEDEVTLAYAAPLPADTTGAVRYYFRGRQRLKATFTEVACRDAETGNAYPYAALVEFGGRRYRGCAARGE